MNKEEFIKRCGEAAYVKMQEQSRKWIKDHPEQIAALRADQCRKGGKRYDKKLIYQQIGLPGERSKVRKKHGNKYRPFKNIIAPLSQIHHEWTPGTAEYTGVALVEADQHMHGFVDPIVILECDITLFTEEEVKGGRK